MKQKTNNRRTVPPKLTRPNPAKLPFIEHAYELRRRLYYIGASIFIWGGAAYFIQQHVVSILLRPAHGERFIYTTPGGGIDFLFRICIYSGLIFSLPVIVYNALQFIAPLITRSSKHFILWGATASGALAVIGMLFGYFIGLPTALHFLTHQFATVQIKPLVTIQSYLQFVIVYMVGSAMLFQLPLLLIFINRVKPLKPKKLLHYERWVILTAFILSGLMNPTPNMLSQLLIAGPFILMYQFGIVLIALLNRGNKTYALYEHDLAVQANRYKKRQQLRPVPSEAVVFEAPLGIATAKTSQATQPVLSTQPQRTTRLVTMPRTNYMAPSRRSPLIGDSRGAGSMSLPLRSIDRLPGETI
jgi:sec-independent protein translocase protein TatC